MLAFLDPDTRIPADHPARSASSSMRRRRLDYDVLSPLALKQSASCSIGR
jgi:hypothetical protein